jgi:hypothetical protein
MKYIFLLSLITLISVYLGYLNYKKIKSVPVIIGLLLIYYWTFNGAWLYVFDALNVFNGRKIGLTYYIIEQKMFPIQLDHFYFLSVLYYGIFFIVLQLTMLYVVRKGKVLNGDKITAVKLIPLNLFLMSFLALIFSYLCVHHKFLEAYHTKTALYTMLRHTYNRFNTLHEIFNMLAIYTAYLTLVAYISGKDSRFLYIANKKFYIGILIFLNITLVSLYFILIGNKHSLIFAGLFGFLFYFANNVKVNWKKIVLFIVIIVSPLTLTDFVRGLPLLNYANRLPEEDQKIDTPTYLNILFNNEMFYAHFSMYGTLSKDVTLTYGKGFINLGESFIPRVILPDRSEDTYTHYSGSIGAKEGQGYTIHYATAWFINFGVIGIILGGIIWGLIWGFLIRKNFSLSKVRRKFMVIIFALAPTLFIAFIPGLIRNGYEGYKALLMEAILIPAIIVFMAQFNFMSIFSKKISKDKIDAE